MKQFRNLWTRIKSLLGRKKENPPIQQVQEENGAGNPNELFLTIPNYGRQLPMKSPGILKSFVTKNQDVVGAYILACLDTAIVDDLAEVILFKLGESQLIAKIERKDFELSLRLLDKQFIKTEEYEKVQQCRGLILKLHVNRVIDESKKM